MTVQSAAAESLATYSTVTALLGSESGGEPWIFQNTFQVAVEGTGKSAVAVYQESSWTPPNRHNSVEFPRLVVDVLSAPSLDLLDQIAARDAEERNLVIHARIRAQWHWADGTHQTWGTGTNAVRVLDCVALSAPILVPARDQQSGELKLHRVSYAVTAG